MIRIDHHRHGVAAGQQWLVRNHSFSFISTESSGGINNKTINPTTDFRINMFGFVELRGNKKNDQAGQWAQVKKARRRRDPRRGNALNE